MRVGPILVWVIPWAIHSGIGPATRPAQYALRQPQAVPRREVELEAVVLVDLEEARLELLQLPFRVILAEPRPVL